MDRRSLFKWLGIGGAAAVAAPVLAKFPTLDSPPSEVPADYVLYGDNTWRPAPRFRLTEAFVKQYTDNVAVLMQKV